MSNTATVRKNYDDNTVTSNYFLLVEQYLLLRKKKSSGPGILRITACTISQHRSEKCCAFRSENEPYWEWSPVPFTQVTDFSSFSISMKIIPTEISLQFADSEVIKLILNKRMKFVLKTYGFSSPFIFS
jgi:hypothetical protein